MEKRFNDIVYLQFSFTSSNVTLLSFLFIFHFNRKQPLITILQLNFPITQHHYIWYQLIVNPTQFHKLHRIYKRLFVEVESLQVADYVWFTGIKY